MRSAAGLNHFSPYKNFPFKPPCRIKYRALRLVRLRYLAYSSAAHQRLSSAMTAVMLVAATRLVPFPGGAPAPALVQGLFSRPSGSHSDWEAGSEIGFAPPLISRSWRGIEASCGQAGRGRRNAALFAMLAVVCLLPGCATAPLVQGAGLSSYDGLRQSDGKLTKSRLQVRKEQVAAAKTVNIAPTVFPPDVAPTLSSEQRALVANVVNRALCINLSDRFNVVASNSPADLTMRATITRATPTDEVAAGVSAAASLGSSFIDTSVPIPVPRIPIGLGGLSIEAEAVDRSGRQQAAMVWARGATMFFSTPRASKASDAYDLARDFGDDFAKMLNKGQSPFEGFAIDIPSLQKVSSNMGLAPKYAACETYGRAPGIAGLVGGKLGLPPEWTDDGAKGTRKQ